MRLLAIDPSLRNTGYAVVDAEGRQSTMLDFGVISNPKLLKPSTCLVRIRDVLSKLIREHSVQECAVEGVIFVQSYRTAITLGAARGAAILAAAEVGLPIYEYAPRKVKQAVSGSGSAQKGQVAFMVRALFGLRETPPLDAADAMAVALAHIHAKQVGLLGDML